MIAVSQYPLTEALESLDKFYAQRLPFFDGEFPIIKHVSNLTIIAGITDFHELYLEIINDEMLLNMYREVKERMSNGECLHDAWLQAMEVLYG